MNEVTGPSQLDARLAKAQELIERGKQRRALDELWEAETQARGNAGAIRQMIDFTTAFEPRAEPRVRSRLVELVAALEHDAKTARETDERERLAQRFERRGRRGPIGCLSVLIGAVGGLVVGGYVGLEIAPTPNPNPNSFDLGPAPGYLFLGAILGFFIGPLVVFAVAWAITTAWERWPERSWNRRSGA